MKPALVVLAAGMGSRYGSLKQMDGLGPCGEAIIDYSIYDAVRAGFGKVVFVIRHSFAEDFKKIFNRERFGGRLEVEYVYQELDCLPEGYTVPEGREKPWGTNHAVMMAAKCVREPFAVINSDDFYGRDAYRALAGYLSSLEGGAGRYCMVGYELRNTLSDFGGVSRGACTVDAQGNLVDVVETFDIRRCDDGVIRCKDGEGISPIDGGIPVSMNMWGFTPDYFTHSEEMFRDFLDARGGELKSEFFIPLVVNNLVKGGKASLKVLHSDAEWFGVTFREDRPFVVERIKGLISAGQYPESLWG